MPSGLPDGRSVVRLKAAHPARGAAREHVGSHPVPVALVGACSIPVVHVPDGILTGHGDGAGIQPTYPPDLPSLLPLGGERRRERPKRQPAEEGAPVHHWMTSSARTKSDCGMVSPSVFAVLR